MEIVDKRPEALREPKQVGGYMVIKNPTPEVVDLLKMMNDMFRFNEGGINFKMICKPPIHMEWDENDDLYASVGWKITIPDLQITKTLEERIKEIQ